MSSTSAMACSFTPGDRQPRRSNARIRMSRSDSSDSSDIRPPSRAGARFHPRPYLSGRPVPRRPVPRRPVPRWPVPRWPVPPRTADVRSRVVTHFRYLSFLTDYGLEDGFVAACHGVSARIAPHATIIDVTHLVPPGDVRRGAAVLAQTVPYLPPAVHVAVVDPGVGTARLGVAVQAGGLLFVGPDNGLLSWAVAGVGGAERAVKLSKSDLWLHPVSPTFHGRDIFTPVAARLANGADLNAVGTEIGVDDLVTLPAPTSRLHDGEVEGEVMSVDRFGNVQ